MSLDFTLKITCPGGTVAVGGYTSAPDGIDATHARRADGRAILPATALRGALRETYEAILRADGQPACSGGDGVEPYMRASASTPSGSCALLSGGPCKACQLFGTRRTAIEAGERHFSKLVLCDAVLDGVAEWSIRHGVAIDRKRRSAAEHLLFDRYCPTAAPGLEFRASGRLLDDALERDLRAAALLTQHIGGGRSRGMGRIELALEFAEKAASNAVKIEHDAIRVVVTLEQPACVGVPFARENLRETRLEVPGSALRGAIGFAIAESLSDPDADLPFQALVSDSAGASFGFLYSGDADASFIGPMPLSARYCRANRSHPPHDVTLDRVALALASGPAEAGTVVVGNREGCSVCGAPVKATTAVRGGGQTRTRIVDRVSLDRRQRSALEGALFSYELIEVGSRFVADITQIPVASRERLGQGLVAPLSLGRGRSNGWGTAKVEVRPIPTRRDLTARGTEFERALRARLKVAGIDDAPATRFVPISLLSPLLPGDEDGSATLASALGVGAESCVVRIRRFGAEGGWDQRRTTNDARNTVRQSVVAGSVFVFDLGRPWRDALSTLDALEKSGLGENTHQGFGRVVVFDPALCSSTEKKK
jgi:CRISPR/Cas system CSM-associated protein Csm3 (group 7 of RAMP superfamily)